MPNRNAEYEREGLRARVKKKVSHPPIYTMLRTSEPKVSGLGGLTGGNPLGRRGAGMRVIAPGAGLGGGGIDTRTEMGGKDGLV